MKRFTTLIALLPGAALAHGGHPPVADAAHGWAHIGVPLALALGAGLVAYLIARGRS